MTSRTQGLFTVGDEPDFIAGPGCLVFVPRGVRHRIQGAGPEPLVWLSIVTPNLDSPDEVVEDGRMTGDQGLGHGGRRRR